MSSLEKTFELSKRGSTVRQEIIAGLTTFLAMVFSGRAWFDLNRLLGKCANGDRLCDFINGFHRI